jgi:protoporphyrinogen/coproporphyrinogen III oxidase
LDGSVPDMGYEVAVVGAGISGLGAGYRLQQAGLRPVVFEAESFLGGRMSSEEVDGFVIDRAAYTFPEFHRKLTIFLQEAGLPQALVPTPGTSATVRGGKEHPLKIGSPSDFLRYRLLSWRTKKDLVQLFLHAQTLGRALDWKHPTARTFELEEESASEYLLEHFGEEMLERVAYPIFCEIFLGEPEGNSKLAFLATIRNLTRFRIFSLAGGMGALPGRMAEGLDVRLGAPVLRIECRGTAGPYELEIGGASPERRVFDAVVSAVPLPAVSRLLAEVPEGLRAHLGCADYAPSVVVALALHRPIPDGALITSLLRTEFRTLGTLVRDRHKGPGRAPDSRDLMTAVLTEPASRRLLGEDNDHVTEQVLAEIERLVPGVSNQVLFSRVYRWEFGAVQLRPGTLRRQAAARSALAAAWPNLCFASDGLYKSSLEVSFKTGVAAAEEILAGR